MSSGFVSSSQLDEEKKKRQEEWEKVRKAEDPLDAPEVEVCNKSLFEQLRNNREKADLEKAEATKLSSIIRGIDEDESQFLTMVSEVRKNQEKAKKIEESSVLREMARAQSSLGAPSSAQISPIPIPPKNSVPVAPPSKQAALISTLIKRKATTSQEEPATKKNTDSAAVVPAQIVGRLPSLVDYGSEEDCSSSDREDSSSEDACAILPIIKRAPPKKKAE